MAAVPGGVALRDGEGVVHVQLLDHVSRSLPEMLWLTQMEQKGEEVTIEGRAATLVAISDFVGNLGNGTLLRRPIGTSLGFDQWQSTSPAS